MLSDERLSEIGGLQDISTATARELLADLLEWRRRAEWLMKHAVPATDLVGTAERSWVFDSVCDGWIPAHDWLVEAMKEARP